MFRQKECCTSQPHPLERGADTQEGWSRPPHRLRHGNAAGMLRPGGMRGCAVACRHGNAGTLQRIPGRCAAAAAFAAWIFLLAPPSWRAAAQQTKVPRPDIDVREWPSTPRNAQWECVAALCLPAALVLAPRCRQPPPGSTSQPPYACACAPRTATAPAPPHPTPTCPASPTSDGAAARVIAPGPRPRRRRLGGGRPVPHLFFTHPSRAPVG